VRIGEAAAAIVFGCVTGAVLPAFPVRSVHADDVRLIASVVPTGRQATGAGELIGYTVTVRALGGTAHGVSVEAMAGLAATWIVAPAGCRVNGDGGRLRCDLGDLSGRVDLDLVAHVPAATEPSVTVTTASGTPTETITSSATATPPAGPRPESPSPTTFPRPSMTPSVVPLTAPRPAASTLLPSTLLPSAPRPSAPRLAPPRSAPPRSTAVPASPRLGRRAVPGRAGGRRPAASVPRMEPPRHAAPAPMAPNAPADPDAPSGLDAPAAPSERVPEPILPPSPPTAAGSDAGRTPDPETSDLSLWLPTLEATSPPGATLQSSKDANAVDPPQFSIVRADPVAGSRRAWVTVLGVTIVFETAVLWVAACLSLWRRRLALTRAASHGLATWPRSLRRRLRRGFAWLPRALAGLRR
jgi:hypothetical protein